MKMTVARFPGRCVCGKAIRRGDAIGYRPASAETGGFSIVRCPDCAKPYLSKDPSPADKAAGLSG
jgi:hypothetical protein